MWGSCKDFLERLAYFHSKLWNFKHVFFNLLGHSCHFEHIPDDTKAFVEASGDRRETNQKLIHLLRIAQMQLSISPAYSSHRVMVLACFCQFILSCAFLLLSIPRFNNFYVLHYAILIDIGRQIIAEILLINILLRTSIGRRLSLDLPHLMLGKDKIKIKLRKYEKI